MSRISKKYKIITIAIISVIVIVSLPPLYFFVLNSSKISYGTLHFDKNKELLFLNDTLLWDTGAACSVIDEKYKNKIPYKRIPLGYGLVFDTFRKIGFQKLYYSPQFNFADSLTISKFCFLIVDMPEEIKFNNNMGIIGMDVISKANWMIDFNSEKIDILSQNTMYKTEDFPQLILNYKHNRVPKTQLDFSVCQCENVLIDAGFTEDLALLESDIEIINKLYKPVDTLKSNRYSIYSTTPVIQNCYVYDTISINDVCFNNIQILEGNKRLIGFKFFKRFDKVFLNTKEKCFYFYSAAEDL